MMRRHNTVVHGNPATSSRPPPGSEQFDPAANAFPPSLRAGNATQRPPPRHAPYAQTRAVAGAGPARAATTDERSTLVGEQHHAR